MELSNEDQMMYWLQCPSPHKTWTISFGLESIRALVWLLIRCKELFSRLWSDRLIWEKYHYKATVWYKCGAIPPGQSAGEKTQKASSKTAQKVPMPKCTKVYEHPVDMVQKNVANVWNKQCTIRRTKMWKVFANPIINWYHAAWVEAGQY